jgi:lipid-A-disaccharide synthase-like uncharacterized protein
MHMEIIALWWAQVAAKLGNPWALFGFAAQSMFFMRFLVQWVASERVKRSIVPETFWYFSLAGGVMLFAYAVSQADPVYMLGQGLGLFIYARNIYLIWLHKVRRTGTAGLKAAEEARAPAAE